MFRRCVFALMLVGAAFAGGAAINGPGLAWLQKNFARASIIVDANSAPPPASKVAAPRAFPTAKVPPLMGDLTKLATPPKKKPDAKVDLARAETPLLPELPSTPAAALAPLPELLTPEGDPIPPPLDPVARSSGPKPMAPEPAPLPRLDPGPAPKSDPVARLASVERPEPSPEVSTPSREWSDLRKRMKALGIARYTIEAEVGGRVRFSCVIPVEGLKAVGHQFEAEGDDEVQAAEATLKRITLWKATSGD